MRLRGEPAEALGGARGGEAPGCREEAGRRVQGERRRWAEEDEGDLNIEIALRGREPEGSGVLTLSLNSKRDPGEGPASFPLPLAAGLSAQVLHRQKSQAEHNSAKKSVNRPHVAWLWMEASVENTPGLQKKI